MIYKKEDVRQAYIFFVLMKGIVCVISLLNVIQLPQPY